MDRQASAADLTSSLTPPGGEAPAVGAPDSDGGLEVAYEHHRAALVRYLGAMTRDRDAAEDLCQEAFARLHLAICQGRPPDDQAAWLRRVGRNLAISRARRAQVASRYAARLHEPAGFDPTASLIIERERIDRVRIALGRVPDEERQLLLMAACGFTRTQMGERLGTTAGAVRTRLHRARRQLLGELGPCDWAT